MNILFTGIGGPTPLGLAKSTRMAFPEARLIGTDASSWAPSLYQSDVFDSTFVIPKAGTASYWEEINHLIKHENIDFAFIVPETEVLEWSKRAESHSLPCKTHLPHYDLASFCFDKLKVAELLYPLGLTPKTLSINASDSMVLKDIVYPFWIRVKSGAGALGALKIANPKDLSTWLTLHENRNDFIASEYLPGRNYACKMLYKEGKLIQASTAERIEYLLSAAAPSGISGMCARGRLLNRDDLINDSIKALVAVSEKVSQPLNGIFTVDFKENDKGRALITEINIRHVSFNHAFTLGGSNFAHSTISMFFNPLFQSPGIVHFKEEAYFVRGVDAPLRLVSN